MSLRTTSETRCPREGGRRAHTPATRGQGAGVKRRKIESRPSLSSSREKERECVIVIVIVIGGLKSRGLTKTPIVCTEKISPVETPTIPGLSMLRDTSNSSIAYSSYR